MRNRLLGRAAVRAPETDAGAHAGARVAPPGLDGIAMMLREAPGAADDVRNHPPASRQVRDASFRPSTYDQSARTVELVLSIGAPVARGGFVEELEISEAAIDLARVVRGVVPLLNAHSRWSIGDILGTVISARIEAVDGVPALVATARFSDTEAGREAEGMVARGELRGVSIGYNVRTWSVVEIEEETGVHTWRATAWELLEGSLVPVPADPSAGVRSAASPTPELSPPGSSANSQEDDDMRRSLSSGGLAALALGRTQAVFDPNAAERGAAPAPAEAPAALPVAPAGVGLTDGLRLLEQARTFGADIETQIRGLVTDPNQTVASVESAILAAAARAQTAQTAGLAAGQAARAGDGDRENQREGMVDALVSRMTHAAPSERGRAYRGYRISQLMAERNGIASRDEMEIISRSVGMHTTSDFPELLGSAANRVLLAAYQQAAPIYRTFSRRQNFQDFRPHSMLRIGEFPLLKELSQSGEIKHGSIPDSGETVGLKTRGLNLALTRQALINDDLGAFADMAAGAGRSAAATEDAVAFQMLLSNSGNGPKMSDGKTFFHADHGNLAAAGGAISETTVEAGYIAIRTQKGLGDEVLGYGPSRLLVGPQQERAAKKFVAVVPAATQDEFNPYAGDLTPDVSAKITDKSWRLFVDPNELAAFVYGYLRDAEAPMVSQHEPSNQDGFIWKILHDFAFGAVDYRAGFKNAGQ